MRKILIIGEYPQNHSGFGYLTHNIATAFHKSNKFDDVVCMGIMPRYTNTDTNGRSPQYILIHGNEYIGAKDISIDNIHGMLSLTKMLETRQYTDILFIGDPWYYYYIDYIIALFPQITYHFYCPVEGERLPRFVTNQISDMTMKLNLKKIIDTFDNVIAYSKTGQKALSYITNKCKNYIWHWIDTPSQKMEVHPRIASALQDKFVVGYIGRNGYRKGTDMLLLLANELSKRDFKDVIIFAHSPKNDAYGFHIECLLEQLHPNARNHIIFSEEVVPDIFITRTNNKAIRDIKNGAKPELLEYIYSKMKVMINISRAEGFGFPIAEAMLRKIPVITNRYATPAELLMKAGTYNMAIPPSAIEFNAGGNNSMQAVPNIKGIADMIIKIRQDEEFRQTIINLQYDFASTYLDTNTTPSKERMIEYILQEHMVRPENTHNVIHITSPMKRCGIRTYTTNIIEHIPGATLIGLQHTNHLEKMAQYIKNRVFHIQYESALWPQDKIINLIKELHKKNNTVVTLHSYTEDAVKQIEPFVDHFIFHTTPMPEVSHKSTVLSHPFPIYHPTPVTIDKDVSDKLIIGINGFVLPYKRISEMAAATLQHIYNNKETLFLLCVCSPHEKDTSGMGQNIMNAIQKYADQMNLSDNIHIEYGFKEKNEMASWLSIMDIALCYHNTTSVGVQSGSIRELLATNVVPFVASKNDKDMHKDLIQNKCAFTVQSKEGFPSPSGFATTACSTILSLLKEGTFHDIIYTTQQRIKEYVSQNTFPQASQKHIEIYQNLTQRGQE